MATTTGTTMTTTTITISNGSAKQNDWATKIVAGWLGVLDSEIATTELRIREYGDHLADHLDDLRFARAEFCKAAATWRASEIIDRRNNRYGDVYVAAARKRTETRRSAQ